MRFKFSFRRFGENVSFQIKNGATYLFKHYQQSRTLNLNIIEQHVIYRKKLVWVFVSFVKVRTHDQMISILVRGLHAVMQANSTMQEFCAAQEIACFYENKHGLC